ncbi:putative rta1 domain protein [Lasiodiplodia theobromae]|uniref:Protoporphyrin uptake protein 1 n=1 Tax=Lasiodiplodia theobromae TaxID=45133 RepID=A0A5N5DWJ5_9PEZI|nr:Rta1 domain protein [Lasiodiplodia theobromae]KAB2580534.1 Protoporphyrin uptake protein 1 [Lasiodiplodia theobromae]KAF4540086.1 Rta1 domain protein [Lasiodiplodia theobromae]KAF9632506.1 putative rta1 domain protein [Lasiodiplodia theobromae]
MATDDLHGYKLYNYSPNLAAAIIFVIAFALTASFHTFQLIKHKTWYMLAFLIGGFFEVVGYIGRAASATEDNGKWTVGPYVIQSVFLLVAPALFAASIYMILGRIILLTDGESHAIIKRRWLTKFFVFGDVFSFLMQSTGGGLMAKGTSDPDSIKMAQNIIIGGLILQLVFFGFFIIVAGIFHMRMNSVPTVKSEQPEVRWRHYLTTLYAVSVLIMIRCVFRAVEYIQGHDGYLLTNEVFIYIFDALLMFLVMAYMNWQHPAEIGHLLRGERPSSSGFTLESVAAGKEGHLHGPREMV